MSAGQHDKALLLSEMKSNGAEPKVASGQSLAHRSKSRLDHARNQEFYFVVRIHAEMLDDESADDFKRTAVGIYTDRLTFKLANGFELRPGDERNGSARKDSRR